MISGMLVLAACGGGASESPFHLWDMKAGMPFASLDSIALHDQKERYSCKDSHGSFRVCSIQTLGAFGVMQAIIDSTDRAVLISWFPASEIMSYNDMMAGLMFESQRVRSLWNRVATPFPDPKYRPPARGENWTSEDQRWGAAMIYDRHGMVQEFRTFDQRAINKWDVLAGQARTDSIARAALTAVQVAPTTIDVNLLVDLMHLELMRLVQAQKSFYTRQSDYARELKQLNFSPRPKIDITIGAANPAGWWARASHQSLSDQFCTVWMGQVPNRPGNLGPKDSEPSCSM